MSIKRNGQYIAGSGSPDNKTISKTTNGDMQSIGLIDQNTNNAIKTWTGTKEEYDNITTKDPNTLYNVKDDIDLSISLLEIIYPVGSIYVTENNTCPLQTILGNWQMIVEPTLDKYIIETNINGAQGYRIWNDGYCEQWARYGSSSSYIPCDSSFSITFLKQMRDTDFNIQTNVSGKSGTTSGATAGAVQEIMANRTVTGTSFTTDGLYSNFTNYCYWKITGYLAEGQYTPIELPTYYKFRRVS